MVISFPLRGLGNVRDGLRCRVAVLQVALVCQSIQCWAGAAVLDISPEVIVVGLPITEHLVITLTRGEQTLDDVEDSYIHLAAIQTQTMETDELRGGVVKVNKSSATKGYRVLVSQE